MRITPVSSIPVFKFEMRRQQTPGSFSELVEAMSKKSALARK